MRSVLIALVLLVSLCFAYGLPGQMSSEEEFAYQQYLLQLQQQGMTPNIQDRFFDPTQSSSFRISAYDAIDQLDVNCPSQTFGLTIPPRHVRFWKNFPLTSGLNWSVIKVEKIKVLCVPHQIRMKIAPLIQKIAVERMTEVDPLTVPQILRLADKIVEKTRIELEQTPNQLSDHVDLHDLQGDMEVSGLHGGAGFGFGRGFGWGGLGWGGRGFGWGGLGWGRGLGFGYPGFGFGGYGLGLGGWGGYGLGYGYGGLGYGGLGYNNLGWGYPGYGYNNAVVVV